MAETHHHFLFFTSPWVRDSVRALGTSRFFLGAVRWPDHPGRRPHSTLEPRPGWPHCLPGSSLQGLSSHCGWNPCSPPCRLGAPPSPHVSSLLRPAASRARPRRRTVSREEEAARALGPGRGVPDTTSASFYWSKPATGTQSPGRETRPPPAPDL